MKKFVIPFDDNWLDIGSSYSSLHINKIEWLNEYCNNRWYIEYDGYHYRTYVLIFENDDDHILFLLRWT